MAKRDTSPLKATVERLMLRDHGVTLDSWVAEERAAGASWETLSRRIYVFTKGVVELTGETWRLWYLEGGNK